MGFEFLSLGWLLAAPLFLGLLFILYFLKLKRRTVTISSTYLWRRALDDMRVNSPFQRLRMNLMLLLQAIALLLVILALARPVSNVGGLKGTDSVILIDRSASMLATDGDPSGKTRFERAKELALRVVDDLSYGDRAIVLSFADDAKVLTPLTNSKGVLRGAIENLKPTYRPTRLANAMQRVRPLIADSEREPTLYVFSDGKVGPLAGVALEDRIELKFKSLGETQANLGIAGIDVRAAVDAGEDSAVFVSVHNAGPEPVDAGVDLYLAPEAGGPADFQLVDSREVRVEGNSTVSVPFDVVASVDATQRVKVQLDHEDAQPADDVAYGLLRPREEIRALLVTEGNLFLDSALSADPALAKTPRGTIPAILPDAFDPEDPALLDYHVIVLDRFMPETLPPGNYLTFAAPPKFPGIKVHGDAADPRVLDWDESHEVTRFVNFSTLVLPSMQRVELDDKATVLVRADHGPLISIVRDGDRLVVMCGFDLMSMPLEGAWTFDPSFPIFLANAVRWLGGSGSARRGLLVSTGGTAELRFPNGTAKARITPPQGEPYETDLRAGDDVLRVTGLDDPGYYQVEFIDPEGALIEARQFAANLTDVGETEIGPAETLELEGREVEASNEEIETNRDVWKLAAGLALFFVMLEWWIYNRRVFV